MKGSPPWTIKLPSQPLLYGSFRVVSVPMVQGPGAPVHLGGPRQRLRVDILLDVRHFAVSNGNVEDPLVLERPVRGLFFP